MPPEEAELQDEDFVDLTTIPSGEDPVDTPEGDDSTSETDTTDDLLNDEEVQQAEVFELVVKGEFGEDRKVSVTLDDLKSGFMEKSDYTRKTMDLAKQRDQMAAQIHEANSKHRTEYIRTLETMRKALMDTMEPEFANVNWQTLAKDNPEEYMRLQARGSQFNSLLTRIAQEQDARAREQAQDDYAARTEMIQKSVAQVSASIPGWSDALYSDILVTVAAKYGFSTKEVGEIVDPRLVRAMHDLTRFHKAMDKRALSIKIVQGQAKSVPASGSSGPVPRQANVLKAVERARRSGSLQDAAMALTLRQKTKR